MPSSEHWEHTMAKSQEASTVWTVADLASLYSVHRTTLVSQARRMLRSDSEANEVVQEAFIKFILAAPELDTEGRALAYLRATINNLSLNVIRARGSRPNLVAIDSDTSAERLAELAVENYIPADESLSAAEDAAIIKLALTKLSPAERAALVMWEMEGRSTSEIAAELGIKESAVRHTVSRARTSLRRVLSELIIDQERGLTALDMLSTTYKKAAELAQKSSKVALSLLLVITAFLGFNSLTGNETNVQVNDLAISTPTTVTDEVVTPSAPVVVEPTQKVSKPQSSQSSGISLEEYNDQMDISKAQLESVAVMAETLAMLMKAEGTN
jgi:RNA polymerase sigma factor (sigma-70 family)